MTFKSLFQIHNETINVWTHLLGFVGCVAVFVMIITSDFIDDPLKIKENAKHFIYLT